METYGKKHEEGVKSLHILNYKVFNGMDKKERHAGQ